jgi:hypothetical protein
MRPTLFVRIIRAHYSCVIFFAHHFGVMVWKNDFRSSNEQIMKNVGAHCDATHIIRVHHFFVHHFGEMVGKNDFRSSNEQIP